VQSAALCAAIALPFAVIALALNFSIGPYVGLLGDRVGAFTYNWHHWGAYLSSAKSFKAGLAIYGDFPSQYGLGPSAVIVAMSGIGWVPAMFYSVGATEMLFWACMSYIGLVIVHRYVRFSPTAWFACLAVTTVTCFLWGRGHPFANFTPSLAGMRYLPPAVMVAAILYLDPTKENFNEKRGWLLHLVWALGAVWSLESMFMVSLIWWPYYILIMQPQSGGRSERVASFALSASRLAAIASVSVCIFLACYFVAYGASPSLMMFLAFAHDVPGALPINFSGPILAVVFSFCIAIVTLVQRYNQNGVDADFRRLFCLILFSYAAMVYYIGRSADPNVLALLPYHALVMIELAFGKAGPFAKYAAAGLLSLLVAWMAVGQSGININTFVASLDFNGRSLSERFIKHYENPSYIDRGRAIEYISTHYGESITAFDYMMSVVVTEPQLEWTSYNNTTTYYGLQSSIQKESIKRSKNRLLRSGWIITETAGSLYNINYILGLFASHYSVTEKLVFGTYTAYRFAPKP
jgi:hypothetical protein